MKVVIASAAVLAVAGCVATAPVEPDAWKAELSKAGWSIGPALDSIGNGFSDFRPVGDQRVVLHYGFQASVLITLRDFCFDLPNAMAMGFSSIGGKVHREDSIVVRDGRSTSRCRIESFHLLQKVEKPA